MQKGETLFAPKIVEATGGEAATDFRRARTIEKGHGRLEERTITVSSMLQETSDWPYMHQAFCLEYTSTDIVTGQVSREVRYGITSQPPEVADPKKLMAQVREEWAIETGLHGRRDVTFREDDAHLRTGRLAHMVAVLNNTVIGTMLRHGHVNLSEARQRFD